MNKIFQWKKIKGWWESQKSNHSGLASELKAKIKSEVAPESLKITLFTVWSDETVGNSTIHHVPEVLDNGVPDNNCNAFVIQEDFQPHEAGHRHAQKWTQGPLLVRVKLKILSIWHLQYLYVPLLLGSLWRFHLISVDDTVKTRGRAKDYVKLYTIIFYLSCQCLRYVYCDRTEVAERPLKCRPASFCTAERMSVKHVKSVKGKQNKRRRSNIHKVILVFFFF